MNVITRFLPAKSYKTVWLIMRGLHLASGLPTQRSEMSRLLLDTICLKKSRSLSLSSTGGLSACHNHLLEFAITGTDDMF
jgi:hypothetical protein